MKTNPLNFNLSVHTSPGIHEGGVLSHRTTATLTDTLTVQTSTGAGVGVSSWSSANAHLQLGPQWANSLRKTLAMTKAASQAPEFDAGAWSQVAPEQAPPRLFHRNYQGVALHCRLRLGDDNAQPVAWSSDRFKVMWLEVAESLSAAAVGKDLPLRFIAVTATGKRRELRVTQHTRERTATYINMEGIWSFGVFKDYGREYRARLPPGW